MRTAYAVEFLIYSGQTVAAVIPDEQIRLSEVRAGAGRCTRGADVGKLASR